MPTEWIRINRIDVKSPPHYDLTENALRTNFPINDHLNPLVFHPRSNDENCLAKWRFVPVSAWVDSFRMQFSGFKTTPSTPGGRQATTTQNHARCLYSTTAARGRETISSTQYVRQNYVDCKTARNVDGSGDAGCKCTAFTLARSWAESGLSPSHCAAFWVHTQRLKDQNVNQIFLFVCVCVASWQDCFSFGRWMSIVIMSEKRNLSNFVQFISTHN